METQSTGVTGLTVRLFTIGGWTCTGRVLWDRGSKRKERGITAWQSLCQGVIALCNQNLCYVRYRSRRLRGEPGMALGDGEPWAREESLSKQTWQKWRAGRQAGECDLQLRQVERSWCPYWWLAVWGESSSDGGNQVCMEKTWEMRQDAGSCKHKTRLL